MADGARHDQRGDDEQSDLQEHEERGVFLENAIALCPAAIALMTE
jgi:hypothetical protein